MTASAVRRGFKAREMISCAGHDARFAGLIAPAGMVFIPCKDGISHNEKESAEPKDVAAGAQVISDVLLDMANS